MQPSIAVQALLVNETSSRDGVGFLTRSQSATNSILDGDDSVMSFVNSSDVPDDEVQTSITLPPAMASDELGICYKFLLYFPFIYLSRLIGLKEVTWHGLFSTMFLFGN